MTNVRTSTFAVALAGLLACGVAQAVQRVFVVSTGNDANTVNNCTFANPCRGFAAAMTMVDPGGEVIALDAAGYGAVTITKSVSIIANPGFYAGITAGSGNAVTIATPGVNVLLRGLNINGIGGAIGVNMTNGASLTLDNCVIANFSSSGVVVDSVTARAKISNSVFSGNGLHGLQVANGKADVVGSRANGNFQAGFAAVTSVAGNVATLTVTDSTASGNTFGFLARANAASSTVNLSATRVAGTSNLAGMEVQAFSGAATAIVGSSTFTENGNGLANTGGVLRSLGNNLVDFNSSSNTTGTITAVGGL